LGLIPCQVAGRRNTIDAIDKSRPQPYPCPTDVRAARCRSLRKVVKIGSATMLENTTRLPTACLSETPAKPTRRRSKRATRPQLLSRKQLDGRTNAAKEFDRLCAAIEVDLGGHDQLSAIEVALVEAFAGAAVTLQHLNAQLALGQPIDLSQHAQCVGAMVRVAARLGLQRRMKDVGPSLGEILRRGIEEQQP
jgi:hypothetical protein